MATSHQDNQEGTGKPKWNHLLARITLGVLVAIVVVVVGVLRLTASSAPPGDSASSSHQASSGYQAGYGFGKAAESSGSGPETRVFAQYIYGGQEYACSSMENLGSSGIDQLTPPGKTVPAHVMPPAATSGAAEQWLSGCVAGFDHG